MIFSKPRKISIWKFFFILGKILPPPEAYKKTSKSRRRQRGSGRERKYIRSNANWTYIKHLLSHQMGVSHISLIKHYQLLILPDKKAEWYCIYSKVVKTFAKSKCQKSVLLFIRWVIVFSQFVEQYAYNRDIVFIQYLITNVLLHFLYV